ncbi:MAG: hypothetical protein NTY35_06815 [Planctomycetota bacterium]|nr:hypothetical protein [Planctomycetota bacterium]
MNAMLLVQSAVGLPQASSYAASIDRAFVVTAWFAVFLAILVAGALALALFAPRRDGAESEPATRRSSKWVSTGVAVAGALSLLVLLHGSRVWADVQTVPRGALAIQVHLEKNAFAFTYPGGHVATELHMPCDRPVKLMLRGDREPYTFAVPEFRLHALVAAAQDRDAWVAATLPGEYAARSTTFPRASDAIAAATVVVHEAGGFEKWHQEVSGPPLDLPPVELGARSYQMRGCTQCHSLDGSKLVGPSFKGFLARQHVLVDQTVVEPTDDYIKESILDPTAKVIAGHEPVMPSFRGRLHELEVAGLVAFIKSQP